MSGETSTRCRVLLFGPQAELASVPSVDVDVVPGTTTCADVLAQVASACTALRDSVGDSRLAVDHVLVNPEQVLNGTEELALIGLVGGG